MSGLERILAIVGAVAGVVGLVVLVVELYHRRKWKRRITWDDALRVAEGLLKEIEGRSWKPQVVIGLGRSGGIWGGWVAGNLGSLPFTVVDLKYSEGGKGVDVEFPGAEDVLLSVRKTHGGQANVLVIEGATARGPTIREFLKRFEKELEGWSVKTAVLYRNPASDAPLDYVGKEDLARWPTDDMPFPWHVRAGYRPFLGRVLAGKAYRNSVDLSP